MNTRIMAVALVCGGFMAIAGQPPTTWYVDDDCVAPGSGTQGNPLCLIQDCIDAAMDGDECVVAPGTYFENINFLGKAITLHSSEGAEVTTIDADGSDTVVTCNSAEGVDSVLEGFTITGGIADLGGGMANNNSNPTVINCTFSGNAAVYAGGGMHNQSSSPIVTDCTFDGNTANAGGGMYNFDGNPTVTNCTFSGNTANLGGGMENNGSSPTVTNCSFSRNSASGFGGGMTNGGSSPTVTNCTFSGNTANSGGGMDNFDSSPTVTNCTFSGNTANAGGGMINVVNSSPSVTNCILWGDSPDEIITFVGSTATVSFSDVQGGLPAGTIDGGGNINAAPLFVDAGFWNDNGTPENPFDDIWVEGDYHLLPGSPCIDAADNTAVPEGIVTDLDGNPRFVDDPNTDDTGFGDPPIVDMGAYEFQFQDPCADDVGDGRVTICHLPPGNLNKARTIIVNMRALPAHLAHGDFCGPCEDGDG
ncbi:MAG: right-handed parallel beta-helix repeat-containing protein [Planctomycetota bacterium]|nr:right-handed parallel beta-helix repeat-containing protein [Planctomycetota bacterium]